MKDRKRIRLVQLCCICILSLLFVTSCATKKGDEKKEEAKQEVQNEESEESEESQTPIVQEVLPTDLEELTFLDFGIKNGVYDKGTHKGEYGGSDLNNTVLSGKITFSPKGDTHILIGGKAAWGGFGISVIYMEDENEYVLRLYDTNKDKKGLKFQPYYFYSNVAGVPLIGKEVDMKVSIQYVDNDGDGIENDVKVGMWFGDKLYENQYIYLKDYTDLNYSMGTWMTLVIKEDATLVIN